MTTHSQFISSRHTISQNRTNQIRTRLGMLCAFGCMILASWYLRPSNLATQAVIGLQIAIVGGCLVGIVSLLQPVGSSQTSIHIIAKPVRWRVVGIGSALLAVLIHTNLPFSHPHQIPVLVDLAFLSPHLQFLLLVAGTGLVAWGLGGGQSTPITFQFKSDHGYLLGIIILGLILRIYNLEYGIHRFVDEAHFLVPVVDLRYGFTEPQLLTQFGGITAFSWIFPYWQSISVDFFGSNLTALRMVSVIIGTLTIPVLYHLAKSLFDQRTALLAALILATFPPHLQFSRIGINNIADPLFGLLAITLLVSSLRSGKQMTFALAGLMLGYTHYFYEGGRLFYTSFVFVWIIWLVLLGDRSDFPGISRRNVIVLLSSLLATSLPLYYTWAVHKHAFFPRLDSVTGRGLDQFLTQLARTEQPLLSIWQRFDSSILGFFHLPDQSTFYGGDTSLVLPLLVAFFLMGTALMIWKIRRLSSSLLLGWLAATIFANGLLGVLVQSPRYVVAHPAIALVLALGMIKMWHILVDPHNTDAKWRIRLWITVMVMIAGYQGGYYLTYHLPNYYYEQFYNEIDPFNDVRVKDFDDMLFRLNDLPDNTQVYVISAGTGNNSHFVAYITYIGRAQTIAVEHVYPHEVNEAWLYSLRFQPKNYAFFIAPEDGRTFYFLHENLKITEGQLSPFNIPPERQFILYLAPLTWNFQPIAPSEME